MRGAEEVTTTVVKEEEEAAIEVGRKLGPQTGAMNDRRDEEIFGATSSQNFKFRRQFLLKFQIQAREHCKGWPKD